MNRSLKKMLDFSQFKTQKDVLKHAEAIANELLLNWKIRSFRGSLHSFEALEFYLFVPNVFEDSAESGGASHNRVEQLSSGRFYVHTKSKGDKWTLPIFNRHGIDITCGSRENGIYGGILIRHIGGENHRDGSGRALRVLLRGDVGHKAIPRGSVLSKWSEEEKKILKKLNGAEIFKNSEGIFLEKGRHLNSKKIKVVAKRRIGINATKFAHVHLRFCLVPRCVE